MPQPETTSDREDSAGTETLSQRIRRTLAPAHEAIERLPFAEAMAAGTVARPAYVEALGQLWHVHRALEDALKGAASFQAWGIYQPETMDRAATLLGDLAAFGIETPGDPGPAALSLTQRFAEEARVRPDGPYALIGALYVVEGSRMGSTYLARSLARGFGLPEALGHGLDYHLAGREGRPAAWRTFKRTLDEAPIAENHGADILGGAVVTMDGLFSLYQNLNPRDSRRPDQG